jgi:hypothetical protein
LALLVGAAEHPASSAALHTNKNIFIALLMA